VKNFYHERHEQDELFVRNRIYSCWFVWFVVIILSKVNAHGGYPLIRRGAFAQYFYLAENLFRRGAAGEGAGGNHCRGGDGLIHIGLK
jgi:hypothetical protein